MPDKDKIKKVATNLLIAFVLITIGFSLGKHSVLNRMTADAAAISTSNSSLHDLKKAVKIFYMHSTFRCVTCNDVEARTLELIDKEFAELKQSQKLLWQEVNFQENEALAKLFEVVASCVVVAVVENGQVVDFVRLDETWTLLEKPEEFNAYIRTAINNALNKISGE
ncbi:MAG: hypothetical protein CVU43_20745 [Chloroflexi bacterium HGW-Chloroflexi-5]|nr:MAG: hypothetical protein CVU43_20745 [Chloroflexi bacterium HGW-Chloroflexi-5]